MRMATDNYRPDVTIHDIGDSRGGSMFEYGNGYLEQNEVALEVLRDSMSEAAFALAEQMAVEDTEDENA